MTLTRTVSVRVFFPFCDVSSKENRKYLRETDEEEENTEAKVGDGEKKWKCGSEGEKEKDRGKWTEEGESVPGSL